MTSPFPPVAHDELLKPVRYWTVSAEFWLCDGLRRGTITVAEACAAHALSSEEIVRWYNIFSRDGLAGLRKINNLTSRRRVA
jgi:hypothetical protein